MAKAVKKVARPGAKCRSTQRGGFNPCVGLTQILEDGVPRGARLFRQQMINITTLKPTRVLLVLKSGAHRKKGIFLNFCPACGEPVN